MSQHPPIVRGFGIAGNLAEFLLFESEFLKIAHLCFQGSPRAHEAVLQKSGIFACVF